MRLEADRQLNQLEVERDAKDQWSEVAARRLAEVRQLREERARDR